MLNETDSTTLYIEGIPPEKGIILSRHKDGRTMSNIAHTVIHHSTGFEWGYAGSGPADLALNICETVLKRIGYTGPRIDVWKGTCFAAAWAMHQEFKFEHLVSIHHDGKILPWDFVVEWVTDHTPSSELLEEPN